MKLECKFLGGHSIVECKWDKFDKLVFKDIKNGRTSLFVGVIDIIKFSETAIAWMEPLTMFKYLPNNTLEQRQVVLDSIYRLVESAVKGDVVNNVGETKKVKKGNK